MKEENNETIKVARVDDKDWFLQSLVKMVHSKEMSFGITLNVGGFLVSGTLINEKEYFKDFGSDFSIGIVDPDSTIKDAFAKCWKIDSSNKKQQHSYIHIKEAKFFNTNGTAIPENTGALWRGCISKVDGFSLPSLTYKNT